MNTLIKFETAKLLKEKGFDEPTQADWYILAKDHSENYKKKLPVDESKVFLALDSYDLERKIQIDEEHEHNVYHVMCCPTISQVVMWLYEKHGVWILVDWSQTKWCFSVIDVKEEVIKKASGDRWKERSGGVYLKTELDFNSPTEAYEAAILYTLNNLI